MCQTCSALARGLLLGGLLVAFAAPATLAAEPAARETSAEEHSRRGVELYQAGKLPEAVREMLKAYELAPEAGLLYNIGRIYHRMEQVDLAEHYYKEYVKDPGAEPDRVAKALAHLETLKQQKAATVQQEADAAKAAEPAPAPTPAPASTVRAASTDDGGGGGLQAAAWVTLGVGAATLITGGLLGGLALDATGDISSPTASYDDKVHAQDSAKSLALGADITLGIGAALAATSIVLFIVGAGGGDDETPDAAFAPVLGPHSAGAALQVTFE